MEFPRPTRGDGPIRFGGGVKQIPDFGPLDVPADVYRDEDRYEIERTHVLRNSWILGARGEEIPEPGDYTLFEGHGETVVITRQEDGSLAAFHNVCQHRGPRIVNEPGCGARRFTCPYHGWVYDTTGDLRGVPDREDFAPEQLEGLRAPAVGVEEWQGWIWLYLAGPENAPSFAEYMGPEMMADLEAYNMDGMYLMEKAVYEVPVNYKAVIDGFSEMYHVYELHEVPREAAKGGRNTHYALDFGNDGQHSMMFVGFAEDMEAGADHQRDLICHYTVFPNTVFNNNPQHLQVFNPVPTGPHTTKFICWQMAYRGDEEYQDMVEMLWKGLKGIVEQDVFIYNELDPTRNSMAYTTNRFNERECKAGHYHTYMDKLVNEALESSTVESPVDIG